MHGRLGLCSYMGFLSTFSRSLWVARAARADQLHPTIAGVLLLFWGRQAHPGSIEHLGQVLVSVLARTEVVHPCRGAKG